MKHRPAQVRGLETCDAMVAVAAEMLRKDPNQSLHFSAIARSIPISPSAPYHYFKNIHDLYMYAYDKWHTELRSSVIEFPYSLPSSERAYRDTISTFHFLLHDFAWQQLILLPLIRQCIARSPSNTVQRSVQQLVTALTPAHRQFSKITGLSERRSSAVLHFMVHDALFESIYISELFPPGKARQDAVNAKVATLFDLFL